MTALGFALGVAYVLGGIAALIWSESRFGSRLAARLDGLFLVQLLAVAAWPLTIALDWLLMMVKPRNRRCPHERV